MIINMKSFHWKHRRVWSWWMVMMSVMMMITMKKSLLNLAASARFRIFRRSTSSWRNFQVKFRNFSKSKLFPSRYSGSLQTWNLSKILHRRIFRLKILHRQFHLILTVLVRKNTKNEWKWRNLHRWQKCYTAAGTDRMDKFHLWYYLKFDQCTMA